MNSAFFEFNVATTGLFTAKAALSTASHNISNAVTPGYSRQTTLTRAGIPLKAGLGKGMVGTGSECYGIGQIRDVYLDKKYWSQTCTLGEYSVKTDHLNLIETVFNDLSDTGLTACATDFFNQLGNLSFSSGDTTYRTGVVDTVQELISNLQTMNATFKKQQTDANDEIYSLVQSINSIGQQITTLNKQIYLNEITGEHANDLRDQRNRLQDELSGYINIEVRELKGPNYEANNADVQNVIFINGQEFVNHFNYTPLECKQRETLNDSDDVVGIYDIQFVNRKKLDENGMSGELKGLLDIRDGDGGVDGGTGNDYKGIPYYVDRLNEFARTIARAFNEGKDGKGEPMEGVTGHIDGYNVKGETGIPLFSYTDNVGNIVEGTYLDYSKITAENISISKPVSESPENIAAAKDNNFQSNNEVILSFLKIKDVDSLFAEGNVYDYISAVNSSLGIDNKQSTNFFKYYTDIVNTVDNQRLEVSGVSLNEEMIDLVKNLQLYRASSKLMNVIDSIYNTTINGII